MSKFNHYNYIPACCEMPTLTSDCYTLLNRQEPIHARISTNNERDRRPIDPPPIIQIKINDASPQEIDTFHQNSYFFMCANLAHPTNDNEIYTPTHNALSGQTVSSMYKLKDIDNHDGAFFVFGDLSVKVEGSFRLKLSLFEITSTGAVCLKSIFTQPFIVYPTKKFPGMLDSTFLSRSFSDQGTRIRIRKENRAQMTNNNSCSTTAPANCPSRKRKLEIQTEKYILSKPTTTTTTTTSNVTGPTYPGPSNIHIRYVSTNPYEPQTITNELVCNDPLPTARFGSAATASSSNNAYFSAAAQSLRVATASYATNTHYNLPLSTSSIATLNERRASITSNGTDGFCCNSSYTSSGSSQSSPITTSFSSSRISLPPLSPPPQSYDAIGTSITTSYLPFSATFLPSSPPPSVKLPSIRDILTSIDGNSSYKRQRMCTAPNAENDAAAAMMQLSTSPERLNY